MAKRAISSSVRCSFSGTLSKRRFCLSCLRKASRSSSPSGITSRMPASMACMSGTCSGTTSSRNAGTLSASSTPLRSKISPRAGGMARGLTRLFSERSANSSWRCTCR